VITAITIVVVAVPEGLPLAVTISLAYSMMKMMKDNNLVRQLAACETMGGATNICSDKTGTLTENRMTVMKAFVAGAFNDTVNGGIKASPEIQHLLAVSIGTNSTAYIDKTKNPLRPEHIGSKTECALLEFSENVLNINYTQIRNEYKFKKMYPFSSEKKVMSVLLREHKDFKVCWYFNYN
jgi:magnesium-transporting ATPase (P-type)